MSDKLQPCLWYDGKAEEAAEFYANTFPDSAVTKRNPSPMDWPAGKAGDIVTVEMRLLGRPALLLNGGPGETPNNALSLMVLTDDQAETDRIWDTIVDNGGEAVFCGWCKDRYGYSWQIAPRRLMELSTHEDAGIRAKAFAAMYQMVKIDIAALEAAVA